MTKTEILEQISIAKEGFKDLNPKTPLAFQCAFSFRDQAVVKVEDAIGYLNALEAMTAPLMEHSAVDLVIGFNKYDSSSHTILSQMEEALVSRRQKLKEQHEKAKNEQPQGESVQPEESGSQDVQV